MQPDPKQENSKATVGIEVQKWTLWPNGTFSGPEFWRGDEFPGPETLNVVWEKDHLAALEAIRNEEREKVLGVLSREAEKYESYADSGQHSAIGEALFRNKAKTLRDALASLPLDAMEEPCEKCENHGTVQDRDNPVVGAPCPDCKPLEGEQRCGGSGLIATPALEPGLQPGWRNCPGCIDCEAPGRPDVNCDFGPPISDPAPDCKPPSEGEEGTERLVARLREIADTTVKWAADLDQAERDAMPRDPRRLSEAMVRNGSLHDDATALRQAASALEREVKDADGVTEQREALKATLARIRAAAESDAEIPSALRDFILRETEPDLPSLIGHDPSDRDSRLTREQAKKKLRTPAAAEAFNGSLLRSGNVVNHSYEHTVEALSAALDAAFGDDAEAPARFTEEQLTSDRFMDALTGRRRAPLRVG